MKQLFFIKVSESKAVFTLEFANKSYCKKNCKFSHNKQSVGHYVSDSNSCYDNENLENKISKSSAKSNPEFFLLNSTTAVDVINFILMLQIKCFNMAVTKSKY